MPGPAEEEPEEPDEPDEPDEAQPSAGGPMVPTVGPGSRELEVKVEVAPVDQVIEAAAGRPGVQAAIANQPDIVLLDWVLPDISGIEVCREIRRHGVGCPVLMLTGRTAKVDVVVGLEVGADDYITKPFDARELAARLGAHLRRASMSPAAGGREGVLSLGSVEIDTEGRRVRIGEEE